MNPHRRPGLSKIKLQELRQQRRLLLIELHELQSAIRRWSKRLESPASVPEVDAAKEAPLSKAA